MARGFLVFGVLFLFLVYGCAGHIGTTKNDKTIGNVLKFSLDVVSLGLLLTGHGSSVHIPSASVDTFIDFGKAVDSVVEEGENGDKDRKEITDEFKSDCFDQKWSCY